MNETMIQWMSLGNKGSLKFYLINKESTMRHSRRDVNAWRKLFDHQEQSGISLKYCTGIKPALPYGTD